MSFESARDYLQAEGYGDLGTQALIKYYEEELPE